VVDNAECKELMRKFIVEKPEVRCHDSLLQMPWACLR
jgi:hypothetical protein